MRAIVSGIALAFVLLFLADTAIASNTHGVGTCPAFTVTAKAGSNDLWWATWFECVDSPAEELNFFQLLQRYNWATEEWDDIFPQLGASDFWAPYISRSSTWYVEDFVGSLCYRIKARIFVVEWQKSWYSVGTKYSDVRCF